MLWLLIVVGRSTLYWAARKKNYPRTPGKSARRPRVAVWRRLSVVVWRRLASSLLSFASTTAASVADAHISATAAAIAVVARWVRELVATISTGDFLQLLWL